MTVIKGYNSGTSAWEPVAVGADVTNTLTTKGDLLGRSSSAAARLGVGSNGTVLTADSTEATGLKWATPAAGGMTLLSTTSLSGTTTTVSSIDGTYVNLLILVRGVTFATDGASVEFRLNGTSGIHSIGAVNVDSTTSLRRYTDFFKTDNNTSNTSADNVYAIEVDSYANTSRYKSVKFYGGMQLAVGGSWSINQMGMFQSNSAVTSFSVTTNNAYTLNGGQILIYGVK